MKDEIKKINITFPGQILDYVDTKEHLLELFNYITNLQEKYEEADNDRHTLFERNEKAIEYIKEKDWYLPLWECKDNQPHKDDLLNILEGDNN